MAATNWYVDALNGSDSNSGASWALAWKSLDKVISRSGFGTNPTNVFFRTGVYSLQTTNDACFGTSTEVNVNFIGCGYVLFKQLYGKRWFTWIGTTVITTLTFRNIAFDNFDGIRCLSSYAGTSANYDTKLRFENCVFNGPVGRAENKNNHPSKITCINCSSASGTAMPETVNSKYTNIAVTADAAHVKVYNSSTNYGYKAFDNNAATYWDYASGTTNVRMNIALDAPKRVVRVLCGDAETTRTPKSVIVMGSNISGSFDNLSFTDDTGWNYIATVELLKPAGLITTFGDTSNAPKYWPNVIPNTAEYQFYSFKFVNNWAGASMRLSEFTLQEYSSYSGTTSFIEMETSDAVGTSFTNIDYTRCAAEGANYSGTNGMITNTTNRAQFIGALLPTPIKISSGGAFVDADPTNMNINTGTSPYFPCSSTGWINDPEYAIGTVSISDSTGIMISSGSSARAVSPVFDFGRTATFAGIGYSATEVVTPLGQAVATVQYRASGGAFYQNSTEEVLPWSTMVKEEDQNFSGRYLQYRVLLTLN